MMIAMDSLKASNSDVSAFPFIAAECDNFFLCLPTSDIFSLESIASMKKVSSDDGPLLGVVQLDNENFPIFALNHHMGFRGSDIQDHAIILFKDSGHNFGLICWDVKLTKKEDLNPQPIPKCMLSENSVYTEAGIINGMPACIISKRSLHNSLSKSGLLSQDNTPSVGGILG